MPEPTLLTCRAGDFTVDGLLAEKEAQGTTASLVLPARNEEETVATVVAAFRPLCDAGLLDEILVVDSLSSDRTAEVASGAGATVVALADVAPDVPPLPGKGEAMWRGLQAARGDLVAYADADVLDAGPHYVLGLLGPMLTRPEVQLVKGYYRRPIVDRLGHVEEHGGRVTELVARPLLSLYRPALAQLVQPLAGEWAGRRSLLESLPFPTGYGVEIAVLIDTFDRHGIGALAQSDLGSRTHSHQSPQALGVMAAEVMSTALRRLGVDANGDTMRQFDFEDHTPITTPIPLTERPPVTAR